MSIQKSVGLTWKEKLNESSLLEITKTSVLESLLQLVAICKHLLNNNYLNQLKPF